MGDAECVSSASASLISASSMVSSRYSRAIDGVTRLWTRFASASATTPCGSPAVAVAETRACDANERPRRVSRVRTKPRQMVRQRPLAEQIHEPF